ASPGELHAEMSESAVPLESPQDVTNDPSPESEMPPASEIVEQG
ncbi:MAG: hypothetical protein JWO39_1972, partial [Gemmatimonadetes bacterium]|nr:hypothetical protein [Gemmatimonadota bacterium]